MPLSPPLTPRVERCIEQCENCHAECLEMAMHMCLETGGRYVEPGHFRLMMNCAQICQTTADFMLSRSAFHAQLCGVCAEVCDACGDSCESIGGMDDCVEVCRSCAESCRQVLEFEHAAPSGTRPAQTGASGGSA